MSDDLALVADADGVRTITMNRPERRNALNLALLEALRAAFAGAAADAAVRSVVLAGAGKGFCAGADVTDWAESVEAREPMPASSGSATRTRWCRRCTTCRSRPSRC